MADGIINPDFIPVYDDDCWKCDTDTHYCGGCGMPLDHKGNELGSRNPHRGQPHNARCVD